MFKSQDVHESSANVLSKPKSEISFNYTAKNENELRRIDNLLSYAQKDKIYTPRWLELFKVKRYDDKSNYRWSDHFPKTLIFDYSEELLEYFKNLGRKNTFFILWQAGDNYEIMRLKEQGIYSYNGEISTYDPVWEINYGKELALEVENKPYIKADGALLMPLMLSQAEKKINLNYINDSTAKFSLTFKEFNDVSNRL